MFLISRRLKNKDERKASKSKMVEAPKPLLMSAVMDVSETYRAKVEEKRDDNGKTQVKERVSGKTLENGIPSIATIADMAPKIIKDPTLINNTTGTPSKAKRRSSTDLPDWWKQHVAEERRKHQILAMSTNNNRRASWHTTSPSNAAATQKSMSFPSPRPESNRRHTLFVASSFIMTKDTTETGTSPSSDLSSPASTHSGFSKQEDEQISISEIYSSSSQPGDVAPATPTSSDETNSYYLHKTIKPATITTLGTGKVTPFKKKIDPSVSSEEAGSSMLPTIVGGIILAMAVALDMSGKI